ncbi:MAG: type I DNA topoisomerase [Actinobacteria bacterium]|nr:type I DNA topoisomerase [Actinomycetota bacterium]
MAKQLVIVESPTKAKTLERYLGSDYSVAASRGHVRDLPKKTMGVDVESDFLPEYGVPEEKADTVEHLRKAYRRATGLWLATDFDREGEAIAWHVAEAIGADPRAANRVTFTEITPSAVREAFERPRRIDFDLVNAQQARRILDRIVGYRLSPLLWEGLRRRDLSAGRVQSVALRLIVDREREIAAFAPIEYWSVDARLTPQDRGGEFLARLVQAGEEKLAPSPDKKGLLLSTEEEAEAHVARLRTAEYRVAEVRQKEVKRSPAPPFTTSTLQQEAARKLGFSSRRTMQIAQRLYEGVNIPGEGQVGLITYMRTDSVNIAEQALADLADVVRLQYGSQYALKEPRRFRKKQRGAQEAHEAIRPTSAGRLPEVLQTFLDRDQARLYRLIWQRTVASQMAEARFDQVSVDVEAHASDEGIRYLLRATGQTMTFDGFRRVYLEGRDDTADEDAESLLPALTARQALRLLELLPEQHFTQPPPRYSEASLVKTLEENGIGRPSTYAPTISTLLDRGYVRLEDRRFHPEDIGVVVTDTLVDHFPDIVDVGFTARMEEELDDIAEGEAEWVAVLREFYEPFMEALDRASGKIAPPEVILPELCPRCPEEGREAAHLVEKLGRFGRFVGCGNYPECKYTRPLEGDQRPEPVLLDELCPESGHPLMERTGRFGPFIGCSAYPECKYIKKEPPKSTGVPCPKCGEGELIERRGRFGPFYSCGRYPSCDFSVNYQPLPDPCPECKGLVVVARGGATRCTSCGRAWDAEGRELSAEEAAKLVPKSRGGPRKRTRSRAGAGRPSSRTRAKRTA